MLKITTQRGARWGANRIMGVSPSPAIAECKCGASIELFDALNNECRKCGRWFNMSGQEVVPPSRCDSQGEPYDEDFY